jgi:hypothetical protein
MDKNVSAVLFVEGKNWNNPMSLNNTINCGIVIHSMGYTE